MHKGASQQLTDKHRGARRGWTGLKRAQDGQPNLFSCRFATPFDLHAPLYIATASTGRHIHPFIEESPTRRRSTWRSCLGDGLGHSLAAMVGPTWWSYGGVLEPRLEFVKSFVPSIFDGDINQFLPLLWSTASCAFSYEYVPYAFSRIRSNHGD
jgi:hypothetical protein